MMCNPNPKYSTQPSGSNPSGSPTGKQPQTTSPFLCDTSQFLSGFRVRWESAARRLRQQILKLQNNWLREKLRERGLSQIRLEGCERGDVDDLRETLRWIHANGYSYQTDGQNVIRFLQNGKVVEEAVLFEWHPNERFFA